MALKFTPPTSITPAPDKVQALNDTLGQTFKTLPALWAQYKAQRMEQDLKIKTLDREMNTDAFNKDAKTKELGLKEQDLALQREKEARMAGNQSELLDIKRQLAELAGRSVGMKEEKETTKREALKKAAIEQSNRVIEKVDQALGKIGRTSTGFGALLRNVPGTKAKDLAADIQTIKANVGFAELQAMRQASPTGGALGQVAVQELDALQATIASLDQEQSRDQLEKRLNEIKAHYQNWMKAVEDAESEPTASVSDEDAQALEWANSNPDDPRSAEIKKRLGA